MTVDPNAIPIDIHANKLLDWLISRNHSTREWPEKIAIVRQKIGTAMKDMPENETLGKILVEASPLNYFHCVKIVEVLKTTEADTKNIFGSYGSRRMKDWQEILKLYQKDNLHLAECASILGRNVIYEIPALKRQATRSEQSRADCLKREASYKKQIQECRDKFAQTCKQLGLNFENYNAKTDEGKKPTIDAVGLQIVGQMKQKLPEIFEKVCTQSKGLRDAVAFYRKFLKATIDLNEDQLASCLSVLQTIIEKGNVTTYEWKHGEPPVTLEVPELNYSFEVEEEHDSENAADVDAIDFGDVNSGAGDGIELETGDIDWGDDIVADSGTIDFSIDAVELDTAGIVLENDGIEGGIARYEEALSILENVATRKQFIHELNELQGFLGARIEESKNESSNRLGFAYNDDSLRCENMAELLRKTNQTLAILNETTSKKFLLVRESKRYVTRVAEDLLKNLKLAARYGYNACESLSKYEQIGEEMKLISPRVQNLTKQSRELQVDLAKEISSRYNGRPVFITGGV